MPKYRYDMQNYRRIYTYQEYEVRNRYGMVDAKTNPIMHLDTDDPRFNAASRTLTHDEKESAPHQRPVSDAELVKAELTSLNSDLMSRYHLAKLNADAGYHGPVSPGEARALSRCFAELGMPDLVRRSWIVRSKTVKTRRLSRYQLRNWIRQAPGTNSAANAPIRTINMECLQHCYTFKSPMPDVPFTKFLKLARLYRDKAGLRKAVKAVLDNPDAKNEVDTADAIDILAGLKGMD